MKRIVLMALLALALPLAAFGGGVGRFPGPVASDGDISQRASARPS